jgi:hypothetical protein
MLNVTEVFCLGAEQRAPFPFDAIDALPWQEFGLLPDDALNEFDGLSEHRSHTLAARKAGDHALLVARFPARRAC